MKKFFGNALTIGVGIVIGTLMLGIIGGVVALILSDPSSASGWKF